MASRAWDMPCRRSLDPGGDSAGRSSWTSTATAVPISSWSDNGIQWAERAPVGHRSQHQCRLGTSAHGTGTEPPVYLADASDKPTGVRFADLDGDGRLDVMVDNANVVCDTGTCISCRVGVSPGNPGCLNPTPYKLAVWLNRFKGDGSGGSAFDSTYSGPSVQFTGATPTMVADVDGDGLADLVQVAQTIPFGKQPSTTTITMLLNKHGKGGGWSTQTFTPTETVPFFPSSFQPPFQIKDVNRDGLADLVHQDFFKLSDGSATSTETVLLNAGPNSTAAGSGSRLSRREAQWRIIYRFDAGDLRSFADIDGDGFYDLVDYQPTTSSRSSSRPLEWVMGPDTGLQPMIRSGASIFRRCWRSRRPKRRRSRRTSTPLTPCRTSTETGLSIW